MKSSRAHTVVRGGVTDLVIPRALRVASTTWYAVARSLVAIREAAASDAVGAAIAGIQASAGLADLARRTRGDAVTAEPRIRLRIHTAGTTALEPVAANEVASACSADGNRTLGSGARDAGCAARRDVRVGNADTGTIVEADAANALVQDRVAHLVHPGALRVL